MTGQIARRGTVRALVLDNNAKKWRRKMSSATTNVAERHIVDDDELAIVPPEWLMDEKPVDELDQLENWAHRQSKEHRSLDRDR
jgi:hypothetical protein